MPENPFDYRIGNIDHYYNITDVRSQLLYEAVNCYDKLERYSTINVDTPSNFYVKYWKRLRAAYILQESYLELPGNDFKTWTQFKNTIVDPEIQAVGTYAAFYAWTVIDDEGRLENIKTKKGVLESCIKHKPDNFNSLTYGLITKYYAPIYRAAQYLSGWTMLEEDMDIPDYKREPIHTTIMEHIYKNFSRLTKKDIDEEISQVCVSISSEDYNDYY